MDYKIVLQIFPMLMLLLIVFILLEIKNSSFKIAGTKDWAMSYLFLFLYALTEIFITKDGNTWGAILSSLFYVGAFIYIEYSVSKYNEVDRHFVVSISSGALLLVFAVLHLIIGFADNFILNILFSAIMIIVALETILFIRKTRDKAREINIFVPLCISMLLLMVYFITRIATNFDFGIVHNDRFATLHTYLFIFHIAVLISVSLSMNFIYKWYYVSELRQAIILQKAQLNEITKLSETDDLTKISNRRHIERILKDLIKKINGNSKEKTLSVAILDIDKFKYINDNYGHIVGDRILINFSKIVTNNLQKRAQFGRWGGDEFLLILPNTKIDKAIEILEELKTILKNTDFDIDFALSFSYGVKEYDSSLDYTTYFKTIDTMLYKNKNGKTER